MGLEILNNRTQNTHENEQFRRVAQIIESTFEKLGYNGLFIGNPFNESYYRFRADAILYYDNGLILFDFKDYKGIIRLPSDANEFQSVKWHNESLYDRTRLEIKAGANFINPFRQLVSYRNAFRELVEKNKYLKGINPARICVANIFSGPIEIHNKVPGNLPYYKLVQESDLSNFLYDFASENTFAEDTSTALKNIFPAEKWIRDYEIISPKVIAENQTEQIDNDIERKILDYFIEENEKVLVLESMNSEDRDSWMRFIINEAVNHNIPQVEKWSHSSRISKKIQKRSNIRTEGIYSVIYEGSKIEGQNENISEEDGEQEELMEIIPLKSSDEIDDKALIIIAEAHLISRSLNQSELLRFGSGRLLEDIIKFLDPESSRKIVLIGDPYSLTFGKDDDSALNLQTLSEIYDAEQIKHYRKKLNDTALIGKDKLLLDLANSVEKTLFNNLNYDFDNSTLINLENNSERTQKISSWFQKPLEIEPTNAIFFYSKKDCLTVNKWIKKQCLNNGESLAIGDLLIANNNVTVPDESGFQIPKRLVNGMYFTVLGIKETIAEAVSIKHSKIPVMLSFTKLSVRCLSIEGCPESEIMILNNYFYSKDNLARDEQIAFRIFINKKISAEKSKNKFSESKDFRDLLQDERYLALSKDNQQFIINHSNDLRKFHQGQEDAKNILKFYKKKYDSKIFSKIKDNDLYVNAAHVKYGWAITVHKAIGSNYNEIILKGHRKENDGITNEGYFRWLYSGITAGKIVNITSPKIINPFIDCVFEDNSIGGISIKSKQLLTYQDYKIDKRFEDKIETVENKNVIGAICEISKLLEENGYLLENTKKITEYLTKAFFSIPQINNQKLILLIDNKGTKDNFAVGNIRIDKLNGAEESIINKSLEACLSQQQNIDLVQQDANASSNAFTKSIYKAWFKDFSDKKISLKIIQSHNNQDVFSAVSDDEKVIFRVWYGTSLQNHTKGFFSKVEILEKSSETIVEKIKTLTYGF